MVDPRTGAPALYLPIFLDSHMYSKVRYALFATNEFNERGVVDPDAQE
jgi:hypothetical protein